MRAKKLDAYLVPKNDAFMSTNLPAHKDHLLKLTGFSGSSGFAVVRAQGSEGPGDPKSVFVTDSRYEIAVKDEVDHDVYRVSTKAEPVSDILKEIKKELGEEAGKLRVGLDGHLYTMRSIEEGLGKIEGVELLVN